MPTNSGPNLEKLFERVLNEIPDLVLIKSKHSKIVWANKAFCKIYGMTNSQLHDLIDSPFAEPDYTQQYILDDAWVWNHAKPKLIDCEPVITAEGHLSKYRTRKFPIFDENDNVIYTAGLSSDITESIESAQKLEASSKMASLGEMAGGIAHEINNPLAVISGKVRQLKCAIEQDKLISKEKMIETLQTIESFTQRIAQIITGLRKFSRDGTNDPFEITTFKNILDETLILCSVTLASKGIDLHLQLADDVSISCRPVQMSQVLLNILNNAMDALENEVEKIIWLSTETTEDMIHVRIYDSGRGVPDEIATKIMQPFFTTKEVGKGTGLGLSISQGIIKDHYGELRLDRSISKSCFKISLPISKSV